MATRFSRMFPQLRANHPLPWFSYLKLACRCSLLKTLWCSLRFRGIVMVGRGSKVRVHSSAHITLAPKTALMIGLAGDMPVGAALRLRPRSNLRVDGLVQIMRACSIIVGHDAVLTIGAGTFFNEGSSVLCFITTTIGPGCAIASGVRIHDSDVHKLVQNTADTSPHAPVHIGGNCWIGANALILKGAHLGDGSVVAAGAVVTSKVPPRSLVAGVPARIMRENITWTL